MAVNVAHCFRAFCRRVGLTDFLLAENTILFLFIHGAQRRCDFIRKFADNVAN